MRRRLAAAAVAAVLPATSLRAQSACDGQPIREIRVTSSSLFGIEDEPFPPFVQRLANSLHWRTRPRTVAHDLMFGPGQPCDARRLAETERLLRAQGYVRSAVVTTTPAPGGAVDVDVRTRDDWTLEGSISFDPGRDDRPLRRLRIAEDNLFGRGMRGQLRYRHLERDAGFDVSVLDRHLFGRRLDGLFVAGHSGVGPVGEQVVVRAFETEFDRVAWREGSRYRKEPFVLQSAALGGVAQPLVSLGADLGLAGRFGAPGNLTLVGVVLAFERLTIEGPPEASRPADDSAAAAALAGRWTERRKARAHLLLGARRLAFRQAAGIDAVNALEDVRTGVEAGVVVGKSFGRGRGLQNDWFTAAEAFVGLEPTPRILLFGRGKAEGRWLADSSRWDGVIASGEVFAYAVLTARSVVALHVAGAGGWNTSTPFQLQLAGPFGLRGYGQAGLPVGRRVVARAEQRYFAGTLLGAADVGLAAFFDLGRGWAGDAPFGEDTGGRASGGGGLRIAFPSGSRRVYRLDLAVPLRRGRGLELRLGFGQQFGVTRGEADDVVRSRETVSSATVFNFPRY